jgi:predicted transcriptional regulator
MAARVRLTADVDPDVKKRVRIAAIESESSVSEWVERAVVRELDRELDDEIDGDEGVIKAPPGTKPEPLLNAPRLLDGSKMSDAVTEDRR